MALGEYFNDLVASAMAGYELGLSIDELKTVSSLGTKYTGPRYALRDANVAQVFQNVGTVAVDIYAAAFMGYARPSSSLCPHFLDKCTPPKNTLSSSVLGLRLSGREIGAAVEMRTQQQSTYFTRYRFIETTSAHRETRLSISRARQSRWFLFISPARSRSPSHVKARRPGSPSPDRASGDP